MPKFIDRTGHRYGRLVAQRADRVNGRWQWHCACDCGNLTTVDSRALSRATGRTQSCGCFSLDAASETCRQRTKHGHAVGGKRSRTLNIWSNMMDRCYRPANNAYKHYGGRGIKVHERWHKFENFLLDMGEAPAGLELDRRNNDRDYSKTNCRWVDSKTQVLNRRCTIVIRLRGKSKPLAQWCTELGLNYSTVYHGLRAKWTAKDALQ